MKSSAFENPSKAELEENPELRELLESFDFSTLRSLFEKEMEKAGVERPLTMVDQEKIEEETFRGEPYGKYLPDDKTARLNLARIKSLAETTGIEWGVLAKKIIIHEEIHAITDQEIPQENFAIKERHIGYERSKGIKLKNSGIGNRLNFLWNEGVTEMWARKLWREYLIDTRAKSEEEIEGIFKKIDGAGGNDWRLEHPYKDELELVDLFIARMAKEAGVSEDIVRTAVIHGLLRGESLSELETDDSAENVFPKNFIHDLERATVHNTVRRLKDELNKPDNTWEVSRLERRLKRWLEIYLETNSHI